MTNIIFIYTVWDIIALIIIMLGLILGCMYFAGAIIDNIANKKVNDRKLKDKEIHNSIID